jgi:hypothetical protein
MSSGLLQERLWRTDLRSVEDDLESRYLKAARHKLDFALEVPQMGESLDMQLHFVPVTLGTVVNTHGVTARWLTSSRQSRAAGIYMSSAMQGLVL